METWFIWCVRTAAASSMTLTGAGMVLASLFKFNGLVAGLGLLWIAGGILSFPRMPSAWRRDRPSQKQVDYAAKLGIDVPRDISKGELSDMISRVVGR